MISDKILKYDGVLELCVGKISFVQVFFSIFIDTIRHHRINNLLSGSYTHTNSFGITAGTDKETSCQDISHQLTQHLFQLSQI